MPILWMKKKKHRRSHHGGAQTQAQAGCSEGLCSTTTGSDALSSQGQSCPPWQGFRHLFCWAPISVLPGNPTQGFPGASSMASPPLLQMKAGIFNPSIHVKNLRLHREKWPAQGLKVRKPHTWCRVKASVSECSLAPLPPTRHSDRIWV